MKPFYGKRCWDGIAPQRQGCGIILEAKDHSPVFKESSAKLESERLESSEPEQNEKKNVKRSLVERRKGVRDQAAEEKRPVLLICSL